MPDTESLRILILSGYDAASHRLWRENLMHLLPMHEWTSLTLPPRHFSWRIRGNALSFAYNQREVLSRPYDLLIATSMVDLSTLRGFIPALTKLPTLLYFHENQFAYPTRDAQRNNAETQLVPLYAALCADSLVFNSNYNRSTFLAGANTLLRRLPDHVPKGLAVQLENSHVLPVPVLPTALSNALPTALLTAFPTAPPTALPSVRVGEESSLRQSTPATLEVVWNHRWEYDKGPERLLAVVKRICEEKLNCRLHIVGQQFKQAPEEFAKCQQLLKAHYNAMDLDEGHFGFLENSAQYHALICSCDVVLSTALHDFQGLAVQEATIAGCCPLAPDDLVYPEYLPPENLYSVAHGDSNAAKTAVEKLKRWQEDKANRKALPKVLLVKLFGEDLSNRYQQLFTETILAKKNDSLS
jgi:glycosyltransferase involved in cell wall biosynthesis